MLQKSMKSDQDIILATITQFPEGKNIGAARLFFRAGQQLGGQL
jgi:hypothetical protein